MRHEFGLREVHLFAAPHVFDRPITDTTVLANAELSQATFGPPAISVAAGWSSHLESWLEACRNEGRRLHAWLRFGRHGDLFLPKTYVLRVQRHIELNGPSLLRFQLRIDEAPYASSCVSRFALARWSASFR